MLLKILPLAAVLAATVSAQTPFSCVANAGTPVIARIEGLTEPVGDLLLQCTGGTPTPSGQPIPTFTIQLTLNTNVTSRVLSGNTIDAILSIDDPYPNTADLIPNYLSAPQNSPAPILCPVGSTCADTGGSGTANPWGSATNPYLNQPNIFLGTLTASNTIQWSNIPIDPPGDLGVRVLRIANMRANASQLGYSSGPLPDQVVANVQITGPSSLTVDNPQQSLAYIGPFLTFWGDSLFPDVSEVAIAACTTHNASLIGGSGTSAFDFHVNVSEGFAQAFKHRGASVTPDGNTVPQPAAQNVPGFSYNTETMYYVPSLFSSVGEVGL